ncbi:hemolymph lipopolysaccharide-binding protein-like [Nasonia vitripennis]|uniref:C-type lectin domain-containing protein n=1 Tax=Nasonia vitripennis TaxID=7425 RepID=A0A7M7IYI0_NASVI|nr:hemolymph lipopolysaccharide-binding protein-like [Nasonia vitripennis]
MRILLNLVLLLMCHRASSFPSLFNVSKMNEDNFEKLGILKSNNYFQDAQIFNSYNITVYTPSRNTTTPNKNNQTVQAAQTIKIPEFYKLAPGIGAHRLLTSKKTWNQARNQCITDGAHLVVIKSAEEEEVIKKLLTSQMIDEIWLGIHDLFKKDDWVTIFDQMLENVGYAKWNEGEPNNFGGDEHCGSYYKDGMNDVPCSTEMSFVCKIIV